MRAPPEVPHDTVLSPAGCNPALIFIALSHPGKLGALKSVPSKPESHLICRLQTQQAHCEAALRSSVDKGILAVACIKRIINNWGSSTKRASTGMSLA
jgi:hypothetical protein